MASGSFSVTTDNQYISGYVDWSEVDQGNNSSNVTATMYLSRTNSGYNSYGTDTFHVNINGTDCANTLTYNLTQNSNTQMVTGTVNVIHNSDGTKTITISWSGGGGAGGVFTVTSSSGQAVLDNLGAGGGVIPNIWIWNGSSWVRAKAFKVWNGSSWVDCKAMQAWDGTYWQNTQ